MIKRTVTLWTVLCFTSLWAFADSMLRVVEHPTRQSVDLGSATIVYDLNEVICVRKSIGMLADDIERVIGSRPSVKAAGKPLSGKTQVIIGTIGQSRIIDRLIKKKKIDVEAIRGGWERFVITSIEADNSYKTGERYLVIAGSDPRGTAYGVLSVSEAIGVSPWYWWADVPVRMRDKVMIEANYISNEPSVRYRGIFINDEDWGLKPWAANNYEKELGDIGPKTYAKVCELILRLKGNMLAPAMHSCTGAFYSHADSKVVADSFGIVITTSHCEPLLLNNASVHDWNPAVDGEWDYGRNPEGVRNRWEKRLGEAARYENIYTTAMRGLHDAGLRGNYSMDEKVTLLERVISDQRDMLSRHIGKEAKSIPQIFVPYKETMDVYEHGLRVPEDIMLVWVDDNYGYMKRVSSPEEQRRCGGSGVYYHTSYLGAPHDYLWLNTTPPALMYTELKKAYDTGADRYWLLNVGDIKPCELGMTTFFAMAWDINAFNYQNVNRHQSAYVSQLFGKTLYSEMQSFLDKYYQLAWSRKPEFMGWEREWDLKELESLHDTEFSFDNYNDAQQRLADYKALSDRAVELMASLPEVYRPAFYEMIAFPAMGAYQMNRKFLMAQLNHELFAKGDFAGANWAAEESRQAYDSIQTLIDRYNHQLGGKWNYMMNHAPAWCAKHHLMPELNSTEGIEPLESSELNVQNSKFALNGCTVLDLSDICNKVENGYNLRLIEGIGYDWQCLQLGEQTQASVEVGKDVPRVDYSFSCGDADSIEVTIYTLPIWPIYKGRSTRFGVSVDDGAMAVFANEPKEYSPEWKTQVLMNGAKYTTMFHVQNSDNHKLTFSLIDPGVIIQRVIIDWGGLKKTYVGPGNLMY